MKILVTGGAGMIGSNLAHRLDQLGHDVLVADNFWRGSIENLRSIFSQGFIDSNVYEGDLRNEEFALHVMQGIDVVFHLADVVAGIDWVFSNQFEIWQNNLRINTTTLRAAVSAGVGRFIYVGTACSYPDHLTKEGGRPLIESDVYPANPESSYGWSKLMGEYELGLASDSGLISSSILRLHNVYGFPTEFGHARSQVIPALARKAARFPNEEFVVWGSGSQRRSFIFVSDVVDALVLSLECETGPEAIQIAPEASNSIAEIAEKIVGISGKPIEIIFDRSKPEGDGDRVADTSRAKSVLGWRQQVPIDQGLKLTYEWVANKAR